MPKRLRKVVDRYSSELKSRVRYCKLCERWKRISEFEKYGVSGDKKRRRTCLNCENIRRRDRYRNSAVQVADCTDTRPAAAPLDSQTVEGSVNVDKLLSQLILNLDAANVREPF